MLSHTHSIIIKVISQDEANYALKKLTNKLSKTGLKISSDKIHSYDLSMKTKFDWLGYTFVILPKKSLRYTKLVSHEKNFIHGINQKHPSVLLLYITDSIFTFIKKKLKKEIKRLKHRRLYSVLQKVNSVLTNIADYYGFATMGHRLRYLRHFVDKIFWKTLVEKFRYKGTRRSGWVARTFFVTTISPSGLKWHLHATIPCTDSLKKANDNVLWCVNVDTFLKLEPININLLSKKLRANSFYMCKEEFDSHKLEIRYRRTNCN